MSDDLIHAVALFLHITFYEEIFEVTIQSPQGGRQFAALFEVQGLVQKTNDIHGAPEVVVDCFISLARVGIIETCQGRIQCAQSAVKEHEDQNARRRGFCGNLGIGLERVEHVHLKVTLGKFAGDVLR